MTGWKIGGEGGRSFPFDNPGDFVRGKVLDLVEVQQTDPKDGAPQFWDNGDKKMQYRVTLQTELRDPQNPEDDGKRDIYLRGSRKPDEDGMSSLCAVLEAVKEASGGSTEIKYGADLVLQYSHNGKQNNKAFNPPKKYAAWYTAPQMELEQPGQDRQPPPGPPAQGAWGNNYQQGSPGQGAQGNYQGVQPDPQGGPPPGWMPPQNQRPQDRQQQGSPPQGGQGNYQPVGQQPRQGEVWGGTQQPPGQPNQRQQQINSQVGQEYAYNPRAQAQPNGGPPPGAGSSSRDWPPQNAGNGPEWAQGAPGNDPWNQPPEDPWGPPQDDPWATSWAPGSNGAQGNQQQNSTTAAPVGPPITQGQVNEVQRLGQNPDQIFGPGWQQRVQG